MDKNAINHFVFLLSQTQDHLPPALYRQIAAHPAVNLLAALRDGSLEVVPKPAEAPVAEPAPALDPAG